MKKNKILLASIFFAVFIIGLGIILSNKHIGPSEFFSSLRELNPRVMSLIALPIIAILFVLAAYLRKKSEERKWKKALMRTRAKRKN
jgi:hypothetical protein